MKNRTKGLAALLTVLLLIGMMPLSALAAGQSRSTVRTGQDAGAVMKDALTQMVNNVAEPVFGTVGGEWAVLCLARSGHLDKNSSYFAAYYDRIVETVNQKAAALNKNGALHRNKSSENSRLIVALSAIGKTSETVGDWNLLAPFNDNFKWITRQGINGPIWALIALDTHNYQLTDTTIRQQCIDYILQKQFEDGGWALSGKTADPDITGMALQALAPYKDDAQVKAAIDAGIACLSAMQKEDGGFASWGTVNSESIAQVIVACATLGINPDTDPRFVKNGQSALDALLSYYNADTRMFRHVANRGDDQMATEQAVYALVSYDRLLKGQTSLYDMTDVLFPEEEAAQALAKVKADAKAALDSYKKAADYREAQKAELAKAIADGKAAIDAAADVKAVEAALADAKAVLDTVKTDAQLTEEENQGQSENQGGDITQQEEQTPEQGEQSQEDKHPTETPQTGETAPYMLLIVAMSAVFVLAAASRKRSVNN